jgi:uncharacterized Ntn-hydrolase superfamily protein
MSRILCLLILVTMACAGTRHEPRPPTVATFSIVAFDAEAKELGIAVQSRFLGVGSVVPWARAGVGAVATQAWANVRYGPDGLARLADGESAAEAVEALIRDDADRERRQLGVVDAQGRAAAFTGKACFPWAGHLTGEGYAIQGNILAGERVPQEMERAFRKTRAKQGAELADALVAALRAGQEAGGDRRGKQSAALLVVRAGGGFMGGNDRYIDLRVEDHPHPIRELWRLLELHKRTFPQAHRRK